MLMHQGIGLDAFNAMPKQRAVHALYECCYSVPLAGSLADGRAYEDHDHLFRRADDLLFGLADSSVDAILQAYPQVGRRPGSARSQFEQCAVCDRDPELMATLQTNALTYRDHFGFDFVMFVGSMSADEVLAHMADRMHNDHETERKVVRNELARINRTRLERMLGPEGGYNNW
ncbi:MULTISPECIES: 2-oxo-4-hydroxy-4-carboxy-5-ureidoimidazoline decarboxylase [unclassified Mycolicibacterium]|uniref:2-oxo-4-hydroxy-4-carboxy-5-ureidoimidazoline decarboxylase n=1 Tax=unclassified Mycolicibacterium TaxID=2636767 RepID=UPI001BB31324|nr:MULTISPECIES: 2-oxo-4-hydroxy-4-carboxy-5-ureidoimidazoline decarboxylase [unclassified Mycolicibacterium]